MEVNDWSAVGLSPPFQRYWPEKDMKWKNVGVILPLGWTSYTHLCHPSPSLTCVQSPLLPPGFSLEAVPAGDHKEEVSEVRADSFWLCPVWPVFSSQQVLLQHTWLVLSCQHPTPTNMHFLEWISLVTTSLLWSRLWKALLLIWRDSSSLAFSIQPAQTQKESHVLQEAQTGATEYRQGKV